MIAESVSSRHLIYFPQISSLLGPVDISLMLAHWLLAVG